MSVTAGEGGGTGTGGAPVVARITRPLAFDHGVVTRPSPEGRRLTAETGSRLCAMRLIPDRYSERPTAVDFDRNVSMLTHSSPFDSGSALRC